MNYIEVIRKLYSKGKIGEGYEDENDICEHFLS